MRFSDHIMSVLRVEVSYTAEDIALMVGRSPRAVLEFLDLALKEGIVRRERGQWLKAKSKPKKRAGAKLDLFK